MKFYALPIVSLLQCGVEFHLDRKLASVIEFDQKSVLFRVDAPLLVRVDIRQRDGAGQKFQRAAFGIFNVRRSRQCERRLLAVKITNKLKILQRDVISNWRSSVYRSGGHQC